MDFMIVNKINKPHASFEDSVDLPPVLNSVTNFEIVAHLLRSLSQFDHISLHRERGFEAKAFLNLFRQRLAASGFTVGQDHLRL